VDLALSALKMAIKEPGGGMNTDDPYVHFDAAYVLAALEPDEKAEFEAHLLTCDRCRARVDMVRPVAALLADMPEGALLAALDLDDAGPLRDRPPETLLPGLLRRAKRERQRRRFVTSSLGLVAAACLAATMIVVSQSNEPSRPASQAMRPLVTSPVQATAAVTGAAWGTRIDLRCTYVSGDSSYWYGLVVIDKAGVAHDSGTWRATPGEVTPFTGGTSLTRPQITAIEVTNAAGTPLLTLQL
jgi:hypothetical protein